MAGAWERLVSPRAGSTEEARFGRLFNTLMVISFGIVVALSAIFLLMQPLGLLGAKLSWIAAAFPLSFIPLTLICLAQSRRGRVRPTVIVYTWVNLIAIAVATWLFDGIYSPAWPLFIWTITVAGTLLAPGHALWMTGGVVLYFVLMLLSTRLGLYSPPLSFGVPGREFAHASTLLVMLVSTVGLLTYLNMRSLREALANLGHEIAVRKETERDLRQSEGRFRSIFEHVHDLIYIVEADGRFSSVSPSSERLLGWRPEEWIGRPFPLIVHPDDLPRMQELFTGAMAERELPVFQVRVLTKAGGYLESEISANPIRRGDAMAILGVLRDITERKRAEDQIRGLNEELEAKVKARTRQLLDAQEVLLRNEKLSVLGQVAGSVGHELRNPLGVMSNAVYYLEAVLPAADQGVKEYLEILKSEIANCERIVSDLLDSVRTKPPQPGRVGAAELITQALGRVTVPPSITVSVDLPAELPLLLVDALQVRQVLFNLISNGVEAMPNGGALSISASADPDRRVITVRVSDNGVGMAAEDLRKIFQPLFTTKSRGIGLGLVVVKNLVQANGGGMEVRSEAGLGTTFSITLPSG